MSKLSRRAFLENSMIAAAAAAAGSGGGLAARAADAVGGAGSGKVGPNDKIRIAVVGINGRGGSHIDSILRVPDFQLVAVADADPATYGKYAKTWAAKREKDSSFKDPEFVQDFRKLLENPNIDAVSFATPNHWHALNAIWSVQAGKDVYVEKPACHNVREGRLMVEFARKTGKMVQCGIQGRSTSGMRSAIEFIRSGKIGKITMVRSLCYKRRPSIGQNGAPAKVPEKMGDVGLDLWCGPAPKVVPVRKQFHYDWHWFWDTGNGDLGNQGPHELDRARWGLGKQELPKRVISLGGRLGYTDDAETANTQITLLEWDDVTMISEVRGLENTARDLPDARWADAKAVNKDKDGKPTKHGNLVAAIWYGTEGYGVTTGYGSATFFTPKGEKITSFNGGGDADHFINFAKAVRSRKHEDLNCDIEDGHLSSSLAHLGNISYRLGKPASAGEKVSAAARSKPFAEALERMEEHLKESGVKLDATPYKVGRELTFDPKAETFVGDKDADALLTREYRAGYAPPQKA
jgi:predicted dehydrogenase